MKRRWWKPTVEPEGNQIYEGVRLVWQTYGDKYLVELNEEGHLVVGPRLEQPE